MKHPFIILVFTIISFQSYGQTKDASQNLEQQATKMGTAFINDDYQTFANYIYPPMLKSMGGESNMAASIVNTADNMKAKGATFSNITFDEPSKIVKSGKELQATIAQH